MNQLKLRKSEETDTMTLPADVIEALDLAEDDIIFFAHIGGQIVLLRTPVKNSASQLSEKTPLSLAELMKLPIEERHRLLANAAAEAAEEYRNNPELTEFSAALDGEDWEEMNG